MRATIKVWKTFNLFLRFRSCCFFSGWSPLLRAPRMVLARTRGGRRSEMRRNSHGLSSKKVGTKCRRRIARRFQEGGIMRTSQHTQRGLSVFDFSFGFTLSTSILYGSRALEALSDRWILHTAKGSRLLLPLRCCSFFFAILSLAGETQRHVKEERKKSFPNATRNKPQKAGNKEIPSDLTSTTWLVGEEERAKARMSWIYDVLMGLGGNWLFATQSPALILSMTLSRLSTSRSLDLLEESILSLMSLLWGTLKRGSVKTPLVTAQTAKFTSLLSFSRAKRFESI